VREQVDAHVPGARYHAKGQHLARACGSRASALELFEKGEASGRTAADNQTVRTVCVIGPDKKIKLMLNYPMSTGRNFDEVLRVLDSIQLTSRHQVSTPVNWKQGEDVIIVPAVSNDEAKILYPNGWKQVKPYLRIVTQPGKPSAEGAAQ
jgi:hypothetical protein